MVLKEYRKGNQIFRLIKCDQCGKEVEFALTTGKHLQKRFCNRDCKEKYQSKNKKVLGIKKCLFCRNEFRVMINRIKFCSNSCKYNYRHIKIKDRIDFIKFMQSEKVPAKEIARRLKISEGGLRVYLSKYRMTYKGTKISNKFKFIWQPEENELLINHIHNYKKWQRIDYLLPLLKNRTRGATIRKISALRKQLKKDGYWIE